MVSAPVPFGKLRSNHVYPKKNIPSLFSIIPPRIHLDSKNRLRFSFFTVLFIFNLVSINAVELSLDDAITAAGVEFTQDLEKGSVVAILNISSPSEELSQYVIDTLTKYLVQTRQYRIVDRARLEMIREEQHFQMSGDVSDESMQSIGRMLGARSIITGSLIRSGSMWRFTIISLNVESAEIETMVLLDVFEDPQMVFWITGEWPAIPNSPRLWTIGISGGSTFSAPWVIATLHGTISPVKYSFFEIGCDIGWLSGMETSGYYSLYPFAHYSLFLPFVKKGGWYLGAGGGWMYASYTFDDLVIAKSNAAMDINTGLNIANVLDISYTLRTNFKSMNHKVSAGFVYRFRKGDSK